MGVIFGFITKILIVFLAKNYQELFQSYNVIFLWRVFKDSFSFQIQQQQKKQTQKQFTNEF